jgi:PAS domain S-box-containing protein
MKAKPVILVVDDQPQNIELLEAYLVPQGYEIVKAANGEEALVKLAGDQIDLILLDVMMPGMDGFEVTRRVRQDNTHRLLPIILVTALRGPKDRVKGIEAGCDDFISKPFDEMELLARVRSLLKVKAYNDLMSNYQKELESEVAGRTEELNHAFLFQQRLIDALPVPVFYKDSEGRYLGCNSSYEKFFGQKKDQIIGKSVYELSPKEFADIYHEKDLALLQNPGIQIYESTVKDTAGVVHNVIFHKATFPNRDGSVGGLIGAILDITERKRAEEEFQRILESLRKAFGAIIQVMVSAVEIRDPYTAGHQIRSADLARAIATEMGLSQEKIDGIRMASSIHDIGKLSIPAEILSKPTRLTELEFSLIKEHSRSGYEMLKDVESPWPLAEIVYQHHERMDGSGYPRNLKGDDILMEARIMAVVDVVESMASHRPYRPALGIEAALDEIAKNKGILYDNTVADACLRLFREKGYQLGGLDFK